MAGAAAVALTAGLLWHPGFPPGSASLPARPAELVSDPPSASVSRPAPPSVRGEVLSFFRRGGYTDVIVRNPLADTRRYHADFARWHLNISLRLVPVSPSLVGSVVFEDDSAGSSRLTPITPKGCSLEDSSPGCPYGVRVPADFHGQVFLTIGRAASPGERYISAGSAYAPGEALHGIKARGRTVARVVAALRRRRVAVPVFDVLENGSAQTRARCRATGTSLMPCPLRPSR